MDHPFLTEERIRLHEPVMGMQGGLQQEPVRLAPPACDVSEEFMASWIMNPYYLGANLHLNPKNYCLLDPGLHSCLLLLLASKGFKLHKNDLRGSK